MCQALPKALGKNLFLSSSSDIRIEKIVKCSFLVNHQELEHLPRTGVSGSKKKEREKEKSQGNIYLHRATKPEKKTERGKIQELREQK